MTHASTNADAGVTDPDSSAPVAAGQAAPTAALSTQSRCNPLSATQIQQYADEIAEFFSQNRAKLSVLGSSLSPLGALIDWIDPKSQTGNQPLPEAPPASEGPELKDRTYTALETDLLNPLLGANSNLVPIPRIDGFTQLLQSWKCMTLDDVLSKYGDASDRTTPPIEPQGAETKPGSNWAHHYANTSQFGPVFGSHAILHVPNPYVWRQDEFSLGQVALSNTSAGILQTVEVGWQKFPDMYHDDFPHLFVFYTTNEYAKQGNNIGGYNQKVDGWVQVSKKVHPGDAVVMGSEMYIGFRMFNGNWWVNVNNEWIGYFPGRLFSLTGLGLAGNRVAWYGEIIDYRLDETATYTQMGNGQYASAVSSFMKSIAVEAVNGTYTYVPDQVWANKPYCYSLDMHANSNTDWGSYFFYGGPGKNSPLCK